MFLMIFFLIPEYSEGFDMLLDYILFSTDINSVMEPLVLLTKTNIMGSIWEFPKLKSHLADNTIGIYNFCCPVVSIGSYFNSLYSDSRDLASLFDSLLN